MRQNKDYVYLNQPWVKYKDEPLFIKHVTYQESINHKNLLIKNVFLLKYVEKREQFLKDFDKIVCISRKDKREQAISYIVASKNSSFVNKNKKNYFIDQIEEKEIDEVVKDFEHLEEKMIKFCGDDINFFYYEDLFYENKFQQLFLDLNLKFNELDFDSILNTNKKYRVGEIKTKKTKTLI